MLSIKKTRLTIAVLAVCVFQLHAADWSQWGGSASRNMVSAETPLPDTFVPGEKGTKGEGVLIETTKNVKWAARLGTFSCSTPTVAGGRVFIGGMLNKQGVMNCLDEATGKLLWQWFVPCRADLKEDAMNFRQFPKQLGICSTPIVDGDFVYFVDQNCVVECFDARGQSGKAKPVWSFDMYADEAVHSRPSDACNGSPLIDGDLLYVTTSNGVDRIVSNPIEKDAARKCMAPNAPTLIVLDKRTGKFLARDTAPTAMNMLHGQWSSPSMGVVQGRKLLFLGGGDGHCYAFEALAEVPKEPITLKTAWWVDCNPPEYQSFGGLDKFTHYTLGDKRRKDSLNKLNDGSWVGMSEIVATPVFYKSRVYVAIGRDPDHGRARGALQCINANSSGDSTKTGIVWTYQGLDRSLSAVSIADGLLYIADVAGRVHCLDADTGRVHWVYESGARVIASTMVADGKVYLANEKHFDILKAGTEMKLISQINLGSASWGSAVAANGTLFVPSKSYLWAVK